MKPKVTLKSRGDVCLGAISMPMDRGCINIRTVGFDPMSALRRASSAAMAIATDPTLAPFLPPQVTLAAHMVRQLTKLSEDELRERAAYGEPAERKLAKSILRKMDSADVGAPLKRDYRKRTGGSADSIPKSLTARRRARAAATKRGQGKGLPPIRPKSPIVVPANGQQGPQYYDPYGNPLPPGYQGPGQMYDQNGNPVYGTNPYGNQYPMSPTGMPMTPEDMYAFEMWGEQPSYESPSDLQPDTPADAYFDAYADVYDDPDEADRVLEYEAGEEEMEP